MSQPHGFTEGGARRIVDVVRRVEGMNAHERLGSRPKPQPRGQGGFMQWVLVTSLSTTDGRYPGTWSQYNVEDDTFTEMGDCWITEAEGETLEEIHYLARLQGKLDADSLPVFVVSLAGAVAQGSTVSIVAVTSSTAAATPGSYAHYSCNTLTTDGNTFTSGSAARVMFPNNEIPAVGNYGALYTGTTSGGVPLYVALYLPLQVQATDAGTGDSDATVYGVTHLHFNQGSGLAVSYPATYKVKVAAANASKTHSGVVNLTADQVLGDGDKRFSDGLIVNQDQNSGSALTMKQNGSATPAFEASGNGKARVNTTATTYTLEIGGNLHTTTDIYADGDIDVGDDLRVTDNVTAAVINATTKYQINGVDGANATYTDGMNTTVTSTFGIVTAVT